MMLVTTPRSIMSLVTILRIIMNLLTTLRSITSIMFNISSLRSIRLHYMLRDRPNTRELSLTMQKCILHTLSGPRLRKPPKAASTHWQDFSQKLRTAEDSRGYTHQGNLFE